mmetsp:Transcript_17940/g.36163  ORF Transcript_17940/g.36163 Transcript_17940/m.36163 type:complete len:135 (+) Transcript_17940:981-1385(+)
MSSIPCCRPQKPIMPARDFSAVETQPSAESTVAQPTPEGTEPNAEITIVKSTPEGMPSEGGPPEGGQNVCMPMSTAAASQQSIKMLDLSDDIPENMDDQLPPGMHRRLEKCHLEGFIECVKEHVASLAKCNIRK